MTRRAWCLVILVSVIWCFLQIAIPGRFPGVDESFFKEPAFNLVQHGVLASPAFEGALSLTPDVSKVYAAYQPFYTLCYALWLLVFPSGLEFSLAFDAIIHLIVVLTVAWFLPRLFPSMTGNAVAFTAISCNFFNTCGRPDDLAMILGLLGLGLWLGPGLRRLLKCACAGLLLGLCGFTSLPVLSVFLMFGAVIFLGRLYGGDRKSAVLAEAAVMMISCFVVLAGCLLPYYSREGAYEQYRQHSSSVVFTGVVTSLRQGGISPYFHFLWSGLRSTMFQIPMYLFLLAAAAWLAVVKPDRDRRIGFVAVLAVYFFILVAVPQQFHYMWFGLPMLLGVVMTTVSLRSKLGGILALLILVAVNPVIRDFVKASQATGSQSPCCAAKAIRDCVPCDSPVLVSVKSYFLMRDIYRKMYADYADYPNVRSLLEKADYCVFGAWDAVEKEGVIVSSHLSSGDCARYVKENFEIVADNLPRDKPSFLGFPIGSSPSGYGVIIYKRKSPHVDIL